MVIRFILISFILLAHSMPALAEALDFSNEREGRSSYDTKSNQRSVKSTLKKINSQTIHSSFETALRESTSNNVCAYNINETFINHLGVKKISKSVFEGAIYHLRFENKIDDMVAQILFNAYKAAHKTVHRYEEEHFLPGNSSQREMLYTLIKDFSTKYLNRQCYDDAYRLLHTDLNKVMPLSKNALKSIFLSASNRNLINEEVYLLLERARLSDLHLKSVSLKDYQQKLVSLRDQYPLGTDEVSDFVTEMNDNGLTHRQQLLGNYNDLQIIVMGNLIKKLRTRLESDRIEIMIYDQEGNIEMIPLDPMERFRFSLKLLRKEMHQLAQNSLFNGRAPSYMDLIAASFEIGVVAGTEIDELGSLEEVWNPKKTFWDKASFWVRSFSSVATILIPPPYGFIPVLALVAIEATMDKDTPIDDGSLF